MRAASLRQLASPRSAGDDRVVYFNTWYRGHNNPRYSELLPRLERLDTYLLTFPARRLPRGAAQIAWRRARSRLEPIILGAASRRYRYAFVTETNHLAHVAVPTVVDVDDPRYDAREAALLGGVNVAAYVVTAESAARRFEQLGVERPWYVIPHGAAVETLSNAARSAHEAPSAGYLASFLLLPGDRGGRNPFYDVSHLLELWDEIHARVPHARLRLVGQPGEHLRRRVEGRPDIVLVGRVPRSQLLDEVARFDVALYPRTTGAGVRASKIAEYLAAGVPIVSYDYEVVADVREAGAGLLVNSPREFAAAVQRLLDDDPERHRFAAAAKSAGLERDWRRLIERYSAILDEHLPLPSNRNDSTEGAGTLAR